MATPYLTPVSRFGAAETPAQAAIPTLATTTAALAANNRRGAGKRWLGVGGNVLMVVYLSGFRVGDPTDDHRNRRRKLQGLSPVVRTPEQKYRTVMTGGPMRRGAGLAIPPVAVRALAMAGDKLQGAVGAAAPCRIAIACVRGIR
jgi:hypothetical protein